MGQAGSFSGDSLENVIDERVHDAHGFAGNSMAEEAEARGKAGARSSQDLRYSASRSDSAGRGGREQRGDHERAGGGGSAAARE